MLTAKPSQFKLSDDGKILYQASFNNPLPGAPVAIIRKGRNALAPEVEVLESAPIDKIAARDFLAAWLKAHIAEILGPLVALENTDDLPGPARAICFQLFEAMGIAPRENLEEMIAGLDTAMRQALRAKNVRLGPILIFIPALNKPAAVRLRAALWTLWHDRALPAKAPPDGASSIKVDAVTADKSFYQAVGYPVYGPRAIRIDMLDRVISAVYDNAKEGKFRAEHKMAEWLGCSIDDLYAILEAMGHRKIEEAPKVEEAKAEESKTEEAPPIEAKPDVKPELAMFRLKKGKAFEKAKSKPPRSENKDKPKKFDKKKDERKKFDEPRVMQASVKSNPEDSPFAILQQLKVKKDASGG